MYGAAHACMPLLYCRLDMDAQSKQQEETRNINVSLHTLSKVYTLYVAFEMSEYTFS